MSLPRTLDEVVTGGLCTGCGLCESLAGRDRVAMRMSPVGHLRPHVDAPLDPLTEQRILEVCPGARVSAATPDPGVPVDPVWGPVATVHRSWSTDPDVRFRAAAGGTLTSLARYLLASGEVDAILHVRASTTDPWLTDAVVSRTDEEVVAGAQSRYGPAAPLVHLHRLLDEGLRLAVVAKPCDVTAVRALSRTDPRVRRQVRFLLSIFCGGFASERMPRQVMAHHGVDPRQVTTFQFRGCGWPGPTRVVTREGAVHDLSYDQVWYQPNPPWDTGMQHRCKICPDAIGEQADVCAPDGWVLELGRPIHREAPGVNFCVARTARGARLVRDAAEAGFLELAPLTTQELELVHRDHVPRRTSFPVRILALRLAGGRHLGVHGYHPIALLRRAGIRNSWNAFHAALTRARHGTHREPPV